MLYIPCPTDFYSVVVRRPPSPANWRGHHAGSPIALLVHRIVPAGDLHFEEAARAGAYQTPEGEYLPVYVIGENRASFVLIGGELVPIETWRAIAGACRRAPIEAGL